MPEQTTRADRAIKYPWIRDLQPGDQHLIEGADHRTAEFKAIQAYAWRRGWKLSSHKQADGLLVTRKA